MTKNSLLRNNSSGLLALERFRHENGAEYVDKGQDYYEQQYHDRIVKDLKKRVAEMSFERES